MAQAARSNTCPPGPLMCAVQASIEHCEEAARLHKLLIQQPTKQQAPTQLQQALLLPALHKHVITPWHNGKLTRPIALDYMVRDDIIQDLCHITRGALEPVFRADRQQPATRRVFDQQHIEAQCVAAGTLLLLAYWCGAAEQNFTFPFSSHANEGFIVHAKWYEPDQNWNISFHPLDENDSNKKRSSLKRGCSKGLAEWIKHFQQAVDITVTAILTVIPPSPLPVAVSPAATAKTVDHSFQTLLRYYSSDVRSAILAKLIAFGTWGRKVDRAEAVLCPSMDVASSVLHEDERSVTVAFIYGNRVFPERIVKGSVLPALFDGPLSHLLETIHQLSMRPVRQNPVQTPVVQLTNGVRFKACRILGTDLHLSIDGIDSISSDLAANTFFWLAWLIYELDQLCIFVYPIITPFPPPRWRSKQADVVEHKYEPEIIVDSVPLQKQQQQPQQSCCAACHASGAVKHCMRCRTVVYCNKTCQTNDWSHHKTQCR